MLSTSPQPQNIHSSNALAHQLNSRQPTTRHASRDARSTMRHASAYRPFEQRCRISGAWTRPIEARRGASVLAAKRCAIDRSRVTQLKHGSQAQHLWVGNAAPALALTLPGSQRNPSATPPRSTTSFDPSRSAHAQEEAIQFAAPLADPGSLHTATGSRYMLATQR